MNGAYFEVPLLGIGGERSLRTRQWGEADGEAVEFRQAKRDTKGEQ